MKKIKLLATILAGTILLTGCSKNMKTQVYQQGLKAISINLDTEDGKYDFNDSDHNTIIFSVDGIGYAEGYFVDAGLYDSLAQVVGVNLPNDEPAMPGQLGTLDEYDGDRTFNYVYVRQMSGVSGLMEFDYVVDFGDSNFVLTSTMDEQTAADIFNHIQFKVEQEVIVDFNDTVEFNPYTPDTGLANDNLMGVNNG